MTIDFLAYEYDLEESRNNMIYKSAPSFITGNIMKSKFIDLDMIYDYADLISRYLLHELHPLNAMYIIKWIRDFSSCDNRDIPEDYIKAHNRLITKHPIEEITRKSSQCVYDERDKGYTGFLN